MFDFHRRQFIRCMMEFLSSEKIIRDRWFCGQGNLLCQRLSRIQDFQNLSLKDFFRLGTDMGFSTRPCR